MDNYVDKYIDLEILKKVNLMFESLVDYSTNRKVIFKEQNNIFTERQLLEFYSKVSDDIVSNMYENKELEKINNEYFLNPNNDFILSMYQLKHKNLDNLESFKKCLQQTYLMFDSISMEDIYFEEAQNCLNILSNDFKNSLNKDLLEKLNNFESKELER